MTPQAQQIVDRFKPYVSDSGMSYDDMLKTERICSIQCAIVAVEMVLDNIPRQISGWEYDPSSLITVDNPAAITWQYILTELKNEL